MLDAVAVVLPRVLFQDLLPRPDNLVHGLVALSVGAGVEPRGVGIFEQVLQFVAVPVSVAVGVGRVDVGALERGGAADEGAVRVALDGAAGEIFVAHEAQDAEGLDVLQVVGQIHAVGLDSEKAAVAGLGRRAGISRAVTWASTMEVRPSLW